MSIQYKDTYFLSSQEALKVATQQNKMENGYWLQCCYYEGEKIESDLPNLIHLPIENLVDDLAQCVYRIPEKISFDEVNFSDDIKISILTHFNTSLEYVKALRKELNRYYLETLKNAKLDFDEPLRFYLLGHINTRVMQYVSKNIADTLSDLGHEVCFNTYYGLEDPASNKVIAEFNPHVTININHFNNHYINDDVFNFIWFQDAMPVLTDDSIVKLRKRDSVFYLIKHLKSLLDKKDIVSRYQPFCINTMTYKIRKNIKRERKIVYIGNSYGNRMNTQKDKDICLEMIALYDEYSIVTNEMINEMIDKYNTNLEHIGNILGYIEKDILMIKLASLKTKYKFEIYGNGWEYYEELKPYYKGILTYGEEISKIYNSATYAFVSGGYIMQQRTLEAAASGCIPIVYDTRIKEHSKNEDYFDKSLVFFQSMEQLSQILTQDKVENRNLDLMVKQNSYEHFINNIVDIVNEGKNKI